MVEVEMTLSDLSLSSNRGCRQCMSLEDELTRSRDNFKATLHVLKKKVGATDKLIQRFQENVQELRLLKEQLTERDEQLVAVKGEVKALEFRLEERVVRPEVVEKLEKENKWLLQQKEELETNVESSDSLICQLKAALFQKEKELKDLVLTQELKNLEAVEVKPLKASVKQLTERVEAMKRKLQEDRDFSKELTAMQKKNAVLERDLNKARQEMKKLTKTSLNETKVGKSTEPTAAGLSVASLIAFEERFHLQPLSPLPPSPRSSPCCSRIVESAEDDSKMADFVAGDDRSEDEPQPSAYPCLNDFGIIAKEETSAFSGPNDDALSENGFENSSKETEEEMKLLSSFSLSPSKGFEFDPERFPSLSPLSPDISSDDDDDGVLLSPLSSSDAEDDGSRSPSDLCRLLSPLHQSPLSPLPVSPPERLRRRSVRLIEKKQFQQLEKAEDADPLPPSPPKNFSTKAPENAVRVKALRAAAVTAKSQRKRPGEKAAGGKKKTKGLTKRHPRQDEVQYVMKALLRMRQGSVNVEEIIGSFSLKENVSSSVPLAVGVMQSVCRRQDDVKEKINKACQLIKLSPPNCRLWLILSDYEIQLTRIVLATKDVPSLSNTLQSLFHLLPRSLPRIHEDQWNTATSCARRVASVIRLFTSLCREEGEWERVRVFCYDLLREARPFTIKELSALLAVVSVWPAVMWRQPNFCLYQEGRLCLNALYPQPLLCAIEALIASQYTPRVGAFDSWTKGALMTLCGWSKPPPENCSVIEDFALSAVSALVNHKDIDIGMEDDLPVLTPSACELSRALQLVGQWMGTKWTDEFLITQCLRSVIAEWEGAALKGESARCRIRLGVVCTAVRLCGCLGRQAENSAAIYQNVFTLVSSLLTHLQTTESILPAQLSAAFALADLSVWCCKAALAVIRRWIQRTQDDGFCLILPEQLREQIDLMLKT
eukprot:m.46388 g.46388  ORF g.46388 m.46388 type:complete len:942 (+) comp33694_c0_seq13:120-2945(+)